MKFEIKVPQLSESISNAILLKWYKNIGDLINKNEHLIDIETDKIVLEVLSPYKGKLIKILKNNGDNVISNEIIAILEVIKDNIKEKNINHENNTKQNIKNNTEIKKINIENNIEKKKINIENNIEKKKINNKNLNKNFNINDINKFKINKNKNIFTNKREKKKTKMNSLRLNLANNLIKSKKNTISLTTFNEINMKSIIDLRNQYKDIFFKKYNLKLGFMPFFINAVVYALKKFPIINSILKKDEIISHNYYDINIALNTKRGLITPILKNSENMSYYDIEYNINQFIEKSKNNKLSIDDLKKGTFTISNGGIYGSMLSTPIINYPQSSILGIHAIKDRVIIENNKILIRPISYFALSYDHRIIDGKDAILFLITIKNILENPLSLLLNI